MKTQLDNSDFKMFVKINLFQFIKKGELGMVTLGVPISLHAFEKMRFLISLSSFQKMSQKRKIDKTDR
jgi:hypothetical protein